MKMNENLNRILKSTQKISEQMASFTKVANISKAHSSFTESFEKTQKIASVLTNQPKFYGGGDMIPKADYFERTQKLISTLANHPKIYYGGGKAIDIIGDFEVNANRLKVNIDAINSAVKFNNGEFFNSYGSFAEINSRTLDTLKTFQAVSERNLSVQINKKDAITDRIHNLLYATEDFYNDLIPLEIDWNCYNSLPVSTAEISYNNFWNSNIEEYLYYLTEFVKCENEIEYESSRIKIFKRLRKSIKRGLRKFAINKREFFRKINSFHFKNLDDYHSLPLITSVN